MREFLSLLGLLLVLGIAPAGAEPRTLDQQALRDLYGNGFVMKHRKGWVVEVSGGGKMLFKGQIIDRGRWRIDGDKVCVQWRKIRDGLEACMGATLEGDRYTVLYSDGATREVDTLSRGEP